MRNCWGSNHISCIETVHNQCTLDTSVNRPQEQSTKTFSDLCLFLSCITSPVPRSTEAPSLPLCCCIRHLTKQKCFTTRSMFHPLHCAWQLLSHFSPSLTLALRTVSLRSFSANNQHRSKMRTLRRVIDPHPLYCFPYITSGTDVVMRVFLQKNKSSNQKHELTLTRWCIWDSGSRSAGLNKKSLQKTHIWFIKETLEHHPHLTLVYFA